MIKDISKLSLFFKLHFILPNMKLGLTLGGIYKTRSHVVPFLTDQNPVKVVLLT